MNASWKENHRKAHSLTLAGWLTAASFLCIPAPALGTWSIVLVDTETKELAIGAATCEPGVDLASLLPVVAVDVGVACAQSLPDRDGANRRRIQEELRLGTSPADILALLKRDDPQHESRQYAIIDAIGRAVVHSQVRIDGSEGGFVRVSGDLVIAVLGESLTGAAVLERATTAAIQTQGDLASKLMAAMLAAREMGGDRRCSCVGLDDEACTAPPASFKKAAHNAFMLVARSGDADSGGTPEQGCASGDYFLKLNIANQAESDPDPIEQLRDALNQWRQQTIGVLDAGRSEVVLDRSKLLADGRETAMLTITLRDWQGKPVKPGKYEPWVLHADDSDKRTVIGRVTPINDTSYRVTVGHAPRTGVDILRVLVQTDRNEYVTLLTRPVLTLTPPTRPTQPAQQKTKPNAAHDPL